MAQSETKSGRPAPELHLKLLSSAIYGSVVAGIIIASLNGTWLIAVAAGGCCAGAYLALQTFFANGRAYKFLVSGLLGALGGMLLFQSAGVPAIHLLILTQMAALIALKDWKAFLPFVLLVLASVVFLAISQSSGGRFILLDITGGLGATDVVFYVGFLFVNTIVCGILAETLKKVTGKNEQNLSRLEQLQEYTENNIRYAKEIASGNFDARYKMQEGDILGQSLMEMSKNLKQASLEEKRRNWAVEGIAQTADILRINHENIDELAYNVIAHLVKYIKANQGGLFILNDSEKENIHLELKGCYAFNRRKYLEKKIRIGEGLVGQAYLEKEKIYMTDIPEDYVHISSGLGDANPTSIMITPLKVEEEVIGIIELASFRKFEAHEIEFLEKVSENIASAIISSKVKDQTNKLLKESQEMTEEMRAQEEEMRQNMEELQATQENLQRESKEKEKIQKEIEKTRDFLQNIVNAIPDPVFVKTRDGHRFVMVNTAWENAYGNGQNVIGKNDYDLYPKELAEKYYEDEEVLFADKNELTVEEKGLKDGREIINITKKRIIENGDGEMFLVGINHEITELKEAQEALAKEKYLMDALMGSSSDSIYFKDLDSKFIRVSNNMLSLFNVKNQQEVAGKSDFDFFTEEHARPAFEAEQEIIRTGKPILNLVEKETFEDGRVGYVSTSKMPLKDAAGRTIGTFGISRNITEAKMAELRLEESEKRMTGLLHYIEDMIVFTDRNLVCQVVSPAFLKHTGYAPEELAGRRLTEYIHKEDVVKLSEALNKLKSGKTMVAKYRYKTKAGKYMPLQAEIHDVNENGTAAGYICKLKQL